MSRLNTRDAPGDAYPRYLAHTPWPITAVRCEALQMIRPDELEAHERAKIFFETENPGVMWRVPNGAKPGAKQLFAGLLERQHYLLRVREGMRRDGIEFGGEVIEPV